MIHVQDCRMAEKSSIVENKFGQAKKVRNFSNLKIKQKQRDIGQVSKNSSHVTVLLGGKVITTIKSSSTRTISENLAKN